MVPNWLFLEELVGVGELSWDGVGRTMQASSLGTDLGLGFEASTGCPRLSCACHAQWKESKPQDTKDDVTVENRRQAWQSLLSDLPDLTGGQWQDVMGFLGVERAAPGGKLILWTSNQPK